MTAPMTGEQLDLTRRLATQLRVDSIRCSTQAGSGHPTSSLSAADQMAVLLVGHLHYDGDTPHLAGAGGAARRCRTSAGHIADAARRLIASRP